MTESRRVIVVGGGAAGMMAAVSAARYGASVTLFEKNDRLGKKLRITGKGRCNLTNDCELSEFLSHVPTNPRFLYAALDRFSTADTKAFFEDAGVPLKTERGKRVFPVSDKAEDIVNALKKCLREEKVEIVYEKVLAVQVEVGVAVGVRTEKGIYTADAVIVCTGGLSYKQTGSDGDGYRFAKECGHTVTPPVPSLVPLVSSDRHCAGMQGLSLRNVSLRVIHKPSGKCIYEDFGEMMFTHFGVTGPIVLSASAHIPDISSGNYEIELDLKPALDMKMLDTRILRDFSKFNNRDFVNSLSELLPLKMVDIVVERSGIDPHKKVHSITKEERSSLCDVIKHFRIAVTGFRPINEAIITKGGISVKEIKPGSMASKLVSGLYFAGEVLDLDAYTGGFNLQIAFSTAVLAGESAAMGNDGLYQ